MENTAKLSNSKEVIAYLVEKFPTCFTLEGDARPLKIGIFDDLATQLADDERLSKTRLRSAVRQYTGAWRYLRGVKEGVQRVDLDGADAGLVEAEHESHAQEQLKESQEWAKQKRQERAAESKAAAVKARAAVSKNAQDSVRKEGTRKPKGKKTPYPNERKTKTFGSKPATKQETTEANAPLEAIAQDSIEVGAEVRVQVGSFPIAGTITDLDKHDAQVQLPSGMLVRVPRSELFRA